MRRIAVACFVLAAVSAPSLSRATPTEDNFLIRNTGDLVTLCTSQPTDPLYTASQNFCHGFTIGMYQAIMAEQAALKVPFICVQPQMPTRNDAIAAFVTWAQASPPRLQTAAVEGLASFLAERMPCKSGRRAS
jgi:hypothetical protein